MSSEWLGSRDFDTQAHAGMLKLASELNGGRDSTELTGKLAVYEKQITPNDGYLFARTEVTVDKKTGKYEIYMSLEELTTLPAGEGHRLLLELPGHDQLPYTESDPYVQQFVKRLYAAYDDPEKSLGRATEGMITAFASAQHRLEEQDGVVLVPQTIYSTGRGKLSYDPRGYWVYDAGKPAVTESASPELAGLNDTLEAEHFYAMFKLLGKVSILDSLAAS